MVTKQQPRMSIITLGVTDLKKATQFYQTVMGWTKSTTMSTDTISFFPINQGTMLLSLYPIDKLQDDLGGSSGDITATSRSSNTTTMTMAYNAHSEREVNDIFASFDNNVTILKEPQKVFWGGYSGYMADLDGHVWEIAYNPFLPLHAETGAISSSSSSNDDDKAD